MSPALSTALAGCEPVPPASACAAATQCVAKCGASEMVLQGVRVAWTAFYSFILTFLPQIFKSISLYVYISKLPGQWSSEASVVRV